MSLALFLAGFATFSLIYCTQPLLPEFAREFQVTPAASSMALSLTTGCLAVSIVCVGAWSEAMSRRATMFCSICVASVLNLLAARAPTWGLFLTARALEGLALGGVPAVAMAYLAEETPLQSLGSTMGLYVAGTAFGGMVGRVAIGALTEFTSWRTAIAAMATLDLLIAAGFVALLPASRNFKPRANLGVRYHLEAWAGHLRARDLRLLFLIGFSVMGGFVTVYNYVGFRLGQAPYWLGQSQIGLIFLAYIFGIAASSAAGTLTRAIGRRRALRVGTAIFLAGLSITLAAPLWMVIGGIGLVTAGFFTVHSIASSSVGQLAVRDKGHASSLYLLAYYSGASMLGSGGGVFWRRGGWPAVAAYAAALAVVTLAASMFITGVSDFLEKRDCTLG